MHPIGAIDAHSGLSGLSALTGLSSLGPPGALLYDTFSDAPGTSLSSHVMNVGPGWTTPNGSWSIDPASGEAENTSAAGAYYTAVSNSGQSNVTATLTFTVPTPNVFAPFVIIRYQDANNFWFLMLNDAGGTHVLELCEMKAGSVTVVASTSVTFTSGGSFTLTLQGSGTTLSGSASGSGMTPSPATVSTTSSDFETATLCGIGEYRDGTTYVNPNLFTLFEVTSP